MTVSPTPPLPQIIGTKPPELLFTIAVEDYGEFFRVVKRYPPRNGVQQPENPLGLIRRDALSNFVTEHAHYGVHVWQSMSRALAHIISPRSTT